MLRALRLCVMACLVIVAGSAQADVVPIDVLYENDFEADAYLVGETIDGKDGWVGIYDTTPPPVSGSTIDIVAEPGYGKALESYRAASSTPLKACHSLDTVQSTGVATLSFDAKRTGPISETGWLYINDDAGNRLALFGMDEKNGTSANQFRFHHDVTDSTYFGGYDAGEWYRIAVEMRFSGPKANTLDIVARGPDGSLAGQLLDQPFWTGVTNAAQFALRNYDTLTATQVDNLCFQDGTIVNKIMHGDFDGLETSNLPDATSSIGGWDCTAETTAGVISIVDHPNGVPGDHALRFDGHGPDGGPSGTVQQIFATPYAEGSHKLVMEHDLITVAGQEGGSFGFQCGGDTAVGIGLRNEDGGYNIGHWPSGSFTKLGGYTPGQAYRLRTSADLETGTWDLYIQGGPEYTRWTQIGKQLDLRTSGLSNIDRVFFATSTYGDDIYYVDNVEAASTADLPIAIHYQNDFDTYNPGNLTGQDGWTLVEGSVSDVQVGADSAYGGQLVAMSGSRVTAYQDMDVVVESGIVEFRADARWVGGSGHGLFYIGDSDLTMTSDGWAPLTANFGFGANGFAARPGDGLGGGSWDYKGSSDPNTWYSFAARIYMEGPNRNTWDLEVTERDTGDPVVSWEGLGFRTDYTDVLRLGIYLDPKSSSDALYFDNVDLRDIPEPATMLLLGGGLLALARRRRRT